MSQEKDTSTSDALSESQKENLRLHIVQTASKLLGIPYKLGAEWENVYALPQYLDCSELTEGVYLFHKLRMPDGSQNQYNFTIQVPIPKPGDLAFLGRGGKTDQIYHVGLVFDHDSILEARAFDKDARFRTGEVITRPKSAWERSPNFCGYRAHAKLI